MTVNELIQELYILQETGKGEYDVTYEDFASVDTTYVDEERKTVDLMQC